MQGISDPIERASFEAHMAAAEQIAVALGVERAAPGDVAKALAHAYGQALGIMVMAGAPRAQVEGLGMITLAATKEIIGQVQKNSCAGSA